MKLRAILLGIAFVWVSYLASYVYNTTTTTSTFQLYSTNPDIYRNTSQLIETRGFHSEIHHPVTRDGYIFDHISQSKLINGVYYDLPSMNHTNCSGIEPNNVGQSLAFVLAACGYDVWLGNYRGTRYSTQHVFLSPKSEYWSYSVDELGMYDIPATVEYILSYTGKGTSGMFQLLSTRPSYSALIRPFIALAPVAYVANIQTSILQYAANNLPELNIPFFGIPSQLLAVGDDIFSTFICGNTILQPLCTSIAFALCGYDWANTDQNDLAWIFGHFPDGTSNRNNLQTYGMRTPPIYNLSRINNRYMIFVSGINDFLADPKDIEHIRKQLTVPLYRDYVVSYKWFNHIDFLVGTNVGQLQNSLLLQWISQIYQS
ncbi:Alpha/beta-hydrolase lipase region [Blomia tropicalis]|nr:Alpha/beta-hydrolase lipase region [Blomia tropicalis]